MTSKIIVYKKNKMTALQMKKKIKKKHNRKE